MRVSVATLVRVIFKNPTNGELMLVLERKATVYETENGRVVEVKSQPFGGAIRLLDMKAFRDSIGNFHFDSEHSRAEQDFRIFIKPSAWKTVREFCIQHLNRDNDPVLETNPARELVEEFADALKINLKPNQYHQKLVATVVEDNPSPTENIHANGFPTVRVYRIFEAFITDSSLAHDMMKNSQTLSNQNLCELALEDAQNGSEGKANAILTLPLKQIHDVYQAMSLTERNVPIPFEEHLLDDTVCAILEGILVPKYQRL